MELLLTTCIITSFPGGLYVSYNLRITALEKITKPFPLICSFVKLKKKKKKTAKKREE